MESAMKLRGIVPPMVTPLLDRDTLDCAGLERLIEHILAGGVHGLFILGTTGEAPSLSHRLREELIERTCRQVAGRVPVLAGITDTCFVESLRVAGKAADCGASAVVLAPPYYFPAGQAELLEYLEHLLGELPLPVMLYNLPSHTKLFFEPTTVRVAADSSKVIGLKDSSGNMTYFHQLMAMMKDRPDFALMMGPEELLAESVLMGGSGGVCGGGNLLPRLYVDLFEAACRGDVQATRSLHDRVMAIRSEIYSVGRHPSAIIKGIKCALSVLGICSDFLAEPFHRFRQAERQIVQRRLAEMGIAAGQA